MLITIILTLAVIGLSFFLLGIKTIFVKGGKFPNSHVEANKVLRKRGIVCAKSQDKLMRSRQNLYELINKEI